MSAIFGETLTFAQANGPDVRLRTFGDEHYARYEDLNGYTVVYDDTVGRFCYATLHVNHFRSTGVPVDQPPPAGLAKHLQESPTARHARTEERRMARAARTAPGSDEVVRTFGPNQGLLAVVVAAGTLLLFLAYRRNADRVAAEIERADNQ